MIALVRGAGATAKRHIAEPPALLTHSYVERIMKNTCSVKGCGKPKKYANGLCGMHWVRRYRNGEKQSTVREFGTGSIGAEGYITIVQKGRRIGEHVLVAERALGRRLPRKACVHHVDENRMNNQPQNLVVCPSVGYHKLLHTRADALRAGHPADWRKCWVCGKYDAPENLYIKGQVGHKKCISEHNAAYYLQKKAAHESV